MTTDGAYSPKRTDVVRFAMLANQQLNGAAHLLSFNSGSPGVPASGLLPWWITSPSNTQFVLQPGIYGLGIAITYYVTVVGGSLVGSGARAVFKFNGVNQAWYRVSTTIIYNSLTQIGEQRNGFFENKAELSVATTIEIESQSTIGGDAVLETRPGSHVYFVRYN